MRNFKWQPDDAVFKELLPALKASGIGPDEIHQLLVRNPRKDFGMRRRNVSGVGAAPHFAFSA